MASLWFQNDLNENLIGPDAQQQIEQPEQHSEIITDTAKAEQGYDLCQLCGKQRPPNQMHTIAGNGQCGHFFCLTCLNKRVNSCILKNMDIYCPIDHCQSIFDPQGKLFTSLPESTITKYETWKKSKAYKGRNASMRMSFLDSFLESQQIQEEVQEKKMEINGSQKRESKSQLHQEQEEEIMGRRQQIVRRSIEQVRQEKREEKRSTLWCLIRPFLFLVMLPLMFALFSLFLVVTLLIVGLYLCPIFGFLIQLGMIIYQLVQDNGYQKTQWFYLDIGGDVLCLVLMIFMCCHQKKFAQIIKAEWLIWGKINRAFCSLFCG